MRPILLAVLLAATCLPAAARAQATAAPPPQPGITLTGPELDQLIQMLADAPARWSFGPLQLLLARRNAAPEPKGD